MNTDIADLQRRAARVNFKMDAWSQAHRMPFHRLKRMVMAPGPTPTMPKRAEPGFKLTDYPKKVDICGARKVDICGASKVDTCGASKVDTCGADKVDTCGALNGST